MKKVSLKNWILDINNRCKVPGSPSDLNTGNGIEGTMVCTKVVPGPGSTRGPVGFLRSGSTRNRRAEMRFYTKRGNRGTVSFKMTHIEPKSIKVWLRYDLKWNLYSCRWRHIHTLQTYLIFWGALTYCILIWMEESDIKKSDHIPGHGKASFKILDWFI